MSLVFLSACTKDFLTYTPENALGSEIALTTVVNCEAGAVGLYSMMNSFEYSGRNLIAIGDLAADNTNTLAETAGHLADVEKYNLSTSTTDIAKLWANGYRIISASTKLIVAVDKLIGSTSSKEDIKRLQLTKAQAYGLRAYNYFMLANYFCLPYSPENAQTSGLILMNLKAIEVNDPQANSTLQATYDRIFGDIEAAKAAFEASGTDVVNSTKAQFFINKAAVWGLDARFKLFYGNNAGAIESARKAIEFRTGGKIIYDWKQYLEMWTSTDINSEDMFSLTATAADNLSANSMCSFYAGYGAQVSKYIKSEILNSKTDMRTQLYPTRDYPKQEFSVLKYPNKNNIVNVPVIRLPEMYLTIAEAEAKLNGTSQAAFDALFVIAQRDTAVRENGVMGLQAKYTNPEELLKAIEIERQRELMCEGHRWMDLRRNHQALTRNGSNGSNKSNDYRITFKNWPVYDFAYAIPVAEINANPFIKQNTTWASGVPNPTLPIQGYGM
ncbi:MAG: RagB/SusD family nutrient uptake outer membrane protein [Bacteroidales bacterium]